MDSGKFFRTAGTIFFTGVVQAIIICIFLGVPFPQLNASHDVEALQFQQLPEQKRTQPIQALESQPIPEPVAQAPVAPIVHEPTKPKPRIQKRHQEQVAKTEKPESKSVEPQQPKVLVLSFDKGSSAQPKEQAKQEIKKQEEQPTMTAEEIQRQEAKEEQPKLVPVSDKLAGVTADDSQTEATAAVNQNPTDQDSAEAMDSMEKSGSN